MKTVRKWLAFLLAVGLMVSAMAVFAADEDGEEYTGKITETTYNTTYEGPMPSGSDFGISDIWIDESGNKHWWDQKAGEWKPYVDCEVSSSDSDSKSDESKHVDKYAETVAILQRAEAEAVQHAASDEGFADVGDMYIAREKSMSAGEFYNNAVISTPGIENAVTVGQGGGLIVNGKVTNMSASISKVTNRAYVDSVRVVQEGRVLNVVDVSYPAVEATITFYMPSVTAEDAIVALQYDAGRWVEVEVAEVRADHVTLNMKGNGVVAFIAQ